MPEHDETDAPELEGHTHWDREEHADCPQCVAKRAKHPSSFRDDIERK